MSLIAVFSATMAWSRLAIDDPVRYASQLRPGANVCSSATLIGLLILSMSRRSAAAQLAFRDGGLEGEHGVGVLRRVGIVNHRQRALDVGAIRIELRLERRREVVIAVGQAEAGLAEEQRVHRRVDRIGSRRRR